MLTPFDIDIYFEPRPIIRFRQEISAWDLHFLCFSGVLMTLCIAEDVPPPTLDPIVLPDTSAEDVAMTSTVHLLTLAQRARGVSHDLNLYTGKDSGLVQETKPEPIDQHVRFSRAVNSASGYAALCFQSSKSRGGIRFGMGGSCSIYRFRRGRLALLDAGLLEVHGLTCLKVLSLPSVGYGLSLSLARCTWRVQLYCTIWCRLLGSERASTN